MEFERRVRAEAKQLNDLEAQIANFIAMRKSNTTETLHEHTVKFSHRERLLRCWTGNALTYPQQARAARAVFGGIATEASCTRVFSLAKNILGTQKPRLDAHVLYIMVFLKVNYIKAELLNVSGMKVDEESLVKYTEERARHLKKWPTYRLQLPKVIELWKDRNESIRGKR